MEGTHGNCGNNISNVKKYGIMENKKGEWKEHYWEHVRNTIEKKYSSYPPPRPATIT
jgi:hypothetical protein